MYLALDLSKRSTGWAHWRPGMDVPACGTWELGSELTSPGVTFLRLHQRIDEIHRVTPLECVIYEKPLDPATMGRHSSFDVAFMLIGLAAHVDSYCDAKRIQRLKPSYPNPLALVFAWLREKRARRRLAEIVRDTRASFECERFRRNREAQLRARDRRRAEA